MVHTSIRFKVVVTVVSVFLILLVGFLYILNYEVKGRVIPHNVNRTSQLVDARANQISYWIEQRKIELDMIAHAIKTLNMDDTQAWEYIRAVYGKKQAFYADMGVVTYGGYKMCSDHVEDYIGDEVYYRDILHEQAKFIISKPFERDGEFFIVMLYKVDGVNRDIEFIYAEVPFASLAQIAAKIDIYNGIGEILIRNKSVDDIDYAAHSDFIDEAHIDFETDIQAVRGWSLNYYVTEKNMHAIVDKINRSMVLFAVILLAVMLLLLKLISKSLVQPVNVLRTFMKKVEDGNLAARIGSQRNDELGQLMDSFDDMTAKLEQSAFLQKEMKLLIMQEQIKPHFLYNTLDTIKWVAMDDNSEEAVSLIDSLSTYFRIGLSSGNPFITLDQELEHLDSYLRLQKARYEDRLLYTISYEEHLMDCLVMRILLQPIVENAVIHGVDRMVDTGEIGVDVSEHNGNLVVTIRNNLEMDGTLVNEINQALCSDEKSEEKAHSGSGYGLYSVNHRIKIEYGKQYGLHLRTEKGWAIVTMTIPIVRKEQH